MWVEYTDNYGISTRARIELTKERNKYWFSKNTYENNYYLYIEKLHPRTNSWEYFSRRNITNERLIVHDGDDFYHGYIEDILILFQLNIP